MGRGGHPTAQATPQGASTRNQPANSGGQTVRELAGALQTARELGDIAESLRRSAAVAGVKDGLDINLFRVRAEQIENALLMQASDVGARTGERLSPGQLLNKPNRYRAEGETDAERARNAVAAIAERLRRLRELNSLIAHHNGSTHLAAGIAKAIKLAEPQVDAMRARLAQAA